MDPNRFTRAQLIEFAKNMTVQIESGRITGMIDGQIDIVAAAIGQATLELEESEMLHVTRLAAAHEATDMAQKNCVRLLQLIQEQKFLMKSLRCSPDEFLAVLLDPPVTGRTRVKPETPSKLSASGFSNGLIKLRFRGNNRSGRVTYEIFAKTGDDTKFSYIAMTRGQRFEHISKPGLPIFYRVRARTARGESSRWSNLAAVFPDGPPPGTDNNE